MLAVVAAFSVAVILFATLSAVLQEAGGEVLTHHRVLERLQHRDKPKSQPAAGKGQAGGS